MQEYNVPGDIAVPENWSCVQAIYDIAEDYPDGTMFKRDTGSSWVDVSAKEFTAEVQSVAKGLVNHGIEVGDRIAILSSTRYEWCLFDFAVWAAGASSVPVYDSSSASQIEWILHDSGAKMILVEKPEHEREVRVALSKLDHEVEVLSLCGEHNAISVLKRDGIGVDSEELQRRRDAVKAKDLATLIYTSGTTGRPKGVWLTHENVHAETLALSQTAFQQFLNADSVSLMFLPLAHVLARAVNYAGIYNRVPLAHTADLANIVERFGEIQPNFILSVPRVFEKVFNAARSKAHDASPLNGKIFEAAVDVAVDYSKAKRSGHRPNIVLTAKHMLFDKLVYGKLRAALGGRCDIAISGGAPLSPRLAHFFDGMGVTIYEGYGLTETCAAHCVNTPENIKIGTVGRPLPGHSVRILDDGEVMVHGPIVTKLYWNNEAATNESFEDGWFHTGDLGTLDEDGFLTITGRKKEIIVTAGGKNISPSGLEDIIRQDPLVSEAVCVGDGKPFISVLLTLDEEAFERWKQENNKNGTIAELADDEDLRGALQRAVNAANETVSHTEAIKKFKVLPVQFTEETGELTPSLKVKRKVVHDKFSKEIESLYKRR